MQITTAVRSFYAQLLSKNYKAVPGIAMGVKQAMKDVYIFLVGV